MKRNNLGRRVAHAHNNALPKLGQDNVTSALPKTWLWFGA